MVIGLSDWTFIQDYTMPGLLQRFLPRDDDYFLLFAGSEIFRRREGSFATCFRLHGGVRAGKSIKAIGMQ